MHVNSFPPDQWLFPPLVGLVVGVFFALLAYFLWSLTFGIGGVALVFGAGTQQLGTSVSDGLSSSI